MTTGSTDARDAPSRNPRRGLLARIVPEAQRRTLEELTDDLDLRFGDTASKFSAFWTMLTLSAIIASAGILSDSTATVIGAMIIAPLSTPILGTALAIVKRERTGGMRFVLGGSCLVIVTGWIFSLGLPSSVTLMNNSQVTGRTSPGAIDLVAALATGLAGSVALSRRDVAAVLPGVAIAISLVPPLAVVGVCLGQGELTMAIGALWLFLSNLLAMILSGTLVFAVLGYAEETTQVRGSSRRRANITIGVLLFIVALPLVIHTAATYLIAVWSGRVETISSEWAATRPDNRVGGVELDGTKMQVNLTTAGDLPPLADLRRRLRGQIPDAVEVVIETSVGKRVQVGAVGDP